MVCARATFNNVTATTIRLCVYEDVMNNLYHRKTGVSTEQNSFTFDISQKAQKPSGAGSKEKQIGPERWLHG